MGIQQLTMAGLNYEEAFHALVEQSPTPVWINYENQIVYINRAGRTLLGAERPEQVVGHTPFEFVHPNYHNHVIERVHLVRSGKEPLAGSAEETFLRLDGMPVRVSVSAAIFPYQGRRAVQVHFVDISERVKTEEACRWQADLLEQAYEPILAWELYGPVVYWNHGAEELYGYSRLEVIGRTSHEVLHTEHPIPIAEFELMLEQRGEWTGELAHTTRDGRRIVVESKHRLVRDRDGRRLVLESNRDITVRKQTEVNLSRSYTLISSVLKGIPDPVYVKDLNGRFVLLNLPTAEILHTTPEEAVGRGDRDYLSDSQALAIEEVDQRVMRTGQTEVIEEAVTKQGVIRTYLSTKSPWHDSAGNIAGLIGVSRDITERKQAEQVARQWQRAFEQAELGIALVDVANDSFQAVNAAFARERGYTPEELIGQPVSCLYAPEEAHVPAGHIHRADTGAGHALFESAHRRKDGSYFPVLVDLTVVRDEAGRPASRVVYVHDLTERKRAAEALRQLNETLERRVEERTAQLAEANKELEAFAYSVSHDLRAPLRSIDGFGRILLREYPGKPLDERGMNYILRMSAATVRMGQLIEDLLNLSRVSRSDLTPQMVNLSQKALSIVQELQERDPARNVTVQIQDGLVDHGDSRLLRIALQNLLGNAWKFTARTEHPRIEFCRVSQNEEQVYVVRDNGAGFNMEYASHLFAPFQRLHQVSEFEGTGIGLAIVQRVIHRHGGRIWAEASEGQGAAFYFTLDKA